MSKSASSSKLSTAAARARRQTALRLLRLREAAGITQRELVANVGASLRAYHEIEAGRVRFIALEAFLYLFDQMVERKGLDVALAAILATRWQDTELPGHGVRKTALGDRDTGSSQEAVRQSNGRCKISQYVGPNPTALSVSRSVLRAIERASSSGRALGHESSAAILTAVADTKLINNRPFGAGYAPGGRLLQGRAARLARRVHTAKVTGSNPVSATKRKVA